MTTIPHNHLLTMLKRIASKTKPKVCRVLTPEDMRQAFNPVSFGTKRRIKSETEKNIAVEFSNQCNNCGYRLPCNCGGK